MLLLVLRLLVLLVLVRLAVTVVRYFTQSLPRRHLFQTPEAPRRRIKIDPENIVDAQFEDMEEKTE